ncbi:MAG: ThiF family adenylyltransferase [Candidatus Dadabacteria bacterium]|nr:ThiF family adenylyltransferase [Candidatus Dadabacteria bacterium]
MYEKLNAHLFPGDCDEHGAIIKAGVASTTDGRVRLLARSLHIAIDGQDYVPGVRGYRMLKANFIQNHILECRDKRLVYLAVHNHSGFDSVAFSHEDMQSHERVYPALLDIASGMPVGALVFATNAVAGDIWLSDHSRIKLSSATIIGHRRRLLRDAPVGTSLLRDETYDRQALLFGNVGQQILRKTKIGIIGLGGAGSLLAEYLGHLGVGRFVLIDDDRIEISNLPRVVGATRFDALTWLADQRMPSWIRNMAKRLARKKVSIAKRIISRANKNALIEAVYGNVLDLENANRLLDCDYIFLAADTMRARLLFNAIVHQYLIPGVQVGAKVPVDGETGEVGDIFSIVRPVTPDAGCLLCNQVIDPSKLQEEGQGKKELAAQRYVNDIEVHAPSVITLNAISASQAANDFMLYMTGLTEQNAERSYMRFIPRYRQMSFDEPRKGPSCSECGEGSNSRFALGNLKNLPTRIKS